jgi:hypothetical protein
MSWPMVIVSLVVQQFNQEMIWLLICVSFKMRYLPNVFESRHRARRAASHAATFLYGLTGTACTGAAARSPSSERIPAFADESLGFDTHQRRLCNANSRRCCPASKASLRSRALRW